MSNITTITQTTSSSSSGGILRLRPISPPATPATPATPTKKLRNCTSCKKPATHDYRNCPENPTSKKNLRKSQKRTTVQPKSAEVVNSEDEEQQEEHEEQEERDITESGITPTEEVTIQNAVPTSSSSTASSSTVPSASTSSSSSSGSKRAAPSSSSSSRRKKRHQTEVVSSIQGTDDVTTDSIRQDIERWEGNGELLIAETVQLIEANAHQRADTVNGRYVRMVIALYRASVNASENDDDKVHYQNSNMSLLQLYTEAMKRAGRAFKSEKESKSSYYNDLKAGLAYLALLREYNIVELPNQTIAMHIAAATGRTDGKDKNPNKYQGQPFKPENIPHFWKEFLEWLGTPAATIEEIKSFISLKITKPKGKGKGGKGKGTETEGKGKGKGKMSEKDEKIAALQEENRKLKERLCQYEEVELDDEGDDEEENDERE